MEEENKKKSSKAPIIVLAVITVIVVGIVVFLVCGGDELFVKNNKDEKETKSSSKVIDEDDDDEDDSRSSRKNSKKNSEDEEKDEDNTKDSKSKSKQKEKEDDDEDDDDVKKDDDSSKNKKDNDDKSDKNSNSDSSKISSKITSKEFSIDGVKYKLGTTYSEFEKNGWEIDYTREETDEYVIDANNTDYHSLTIINDKHDRYITACFKNDSDKEANIADCKMYQICVYEYTDIKKYDVDFELPAGIKIGSTRDEVIDAYGKPSNESKGDYSFVSYYIDDIGLYIAFNDDGKANYISYSYYK